MKKTLNYLFLLVILASCSERSGTAKGSPDLTSKIDSTSRDSLTATEELYVLNDSALYLGIVKKFYFKDDNEIYFDLYFKHAITDNEGYNAIVKLGDSVIYVDDDNKRTRIPLTKAEKHFDLTGLLAPLKIYDQQNRFICNATFKRIEYLDQSISPAFIAVFNSEKKLSDKTHYAITGGQERLGTLSFSEIADSALTKKLQMALNIKPCSYLKMSESGRHYLLQARDSTLSIINGEETSYVILSTRDGAQILYRSAEKEHMSVALLVPMLGQTMPLILSACSMPEGDLTWEQLLKFDGVNYQVTGRQRLD